MRPRLFLVACLLALGLSACGAEDPAAPAAKPYRDPGLYAGTTLKRGGLKLPARIQAATSRSPARAPSPPASGQASTSA